MLIKKKKVFANEEVINTPQAVIDFFARLPLVYACQKTPQIGAYLPDGYLNGTQKIEYGFLVTVVNTYTKGALSQLYQKVANEIANIEQDRDLKVKQNELNMFL